MLAMWLVEIYLDRLDQLQDEGNTGQFNELHTEMRAFLAEPRVKVSVYFCFCVRFGRDV